MADRLPARISKELHQSWGWVLALGIVLVLGGIALVLVPVFGGLIVTTWIAALFLVGGVLQIIHAFRSKGWQSVTWQWVSGIIYIVGGVLAFLNPLAGAFAISAILAITFIVDGVACLMFAWKARPLDSWGWIAFSGIVSIAAGVFILLFLGNAAASLAFLGMIAGLTFLFEGIAFTMLGFAARSGTGAQTE